MSERRMVVVKGSANDDDFNYRCVSNGDMRKGQYAVLEMENGSVVNRTLTGNRDEVEGMMASFRGTVAVDSRSSPRLLPLTPPPGAVSEDVTRFRGPKSDEELASLSRVSAQTRLLLDREDVDVASFRGAANEKGFRSAFQATHARGFTQYRGGVQDGKGMCSDLTRVVPHTQEWEERLERAYRGLDAVYDAAVPGATVDTLDRLFMSYMDSGKDVLYGSVVHHTGYESYEDIPFRGVEPYHFLTIGAALSDGKETALVYRSGKAVYPPPPSSLPPPPSPLPPPPSSSLPPPEATMRATADPPEDEESDYDKCRRMSM